MFDGNWGNGMSGMELIPQERIEKAILLIRGQKVMLDKDLAELYRVATKVLNQAVKRNLSRFPDDFMFQLTPEEDDALRSQFVTLKPGRGKHRKYLPYEGRQLVARGVSPWILGEETPKPRRGDRSTLSRG